MITKSSQPLRKRVFPFLHPRCLEFLQYRTKNISEIINDNILKANTTKEQSILKILICSEKVVNGTTGENYWQQISPF